jgi:hypothetical protein
VSGRTRRLVVFSCSIPKVNRNIFKRLTKRHKRNKMELGSQNELKKATNNKSLFEPKATFCQPLAAAPALPPHLFKSFGRTDTTSHANAAARR